MLIKFIIVIQLYDSVYRYITVSITTSPTLIGQRLNGACVATTVMAAKTMRLLDKLVGLKK